MSHVSLSRNSVIVGLAPLIPLPFVDELAKAFLMRKAYAAMAEERGLQLAPDELKTLTRSHDSLILGCLVGALWWPIRKLLRTIFYVLTVKECIDTAAEAAMRAEMVRLAMDRRLLPGRAEDVRSSMEHALKGETRSPVSRVILGKSRPDYTWTTSSDPTVAVAGSLLKAGGGALVVARFVEHLEGGGVGSPQPV